MTQPGIDPQSPKTIGEHSTCLIYVINIHNKLNVLARKETMLKNIHTKIKPRF